MNLFPSKLTQGKTTLKGISYRWIIFIN